MSLLHLIACPTVASGQTITGTAALSLPAVTASGSGVVNTEVTGTAALTLPSVTASGTGAISVQPSTSWVGIPDPQDYLGLNYNPLTATEPADPGNWPSAEAAGYYYVDSSHGSATDTANTYGYPNQPRLTIPTSVTLGAGGKLIIVGDGETYSGSNITITISGATNTANGYAYIKGQYSTSRPIIYERAFTISGSYCICDGIHHKADGQDNKIVAASAYTTVRNFEVTGDTGVALDPNPTGSRMGVSSYNVFYNGSIHDYGNWQTSSANDTHGFKIDGDHHVFVLDVLCYHLPGDSVQVGNGGVDAATYVFLGNVSGYENKENHIDIKGSNHTIISGGYSHTFFPGYGGGAQGEAITVHYEANNVWIINHEIWNCRRPVYTSADSGYGLMYAIGCVFRDQPATSPEYYYNNAAGGALAFCTFHNYFEGPDFDSVSSNVEVKGCCFGGRTSTGTDYDYWVENSTDYTALDSDYNAYESFRCRDNTGSYITSIGSWNGDANSVEGSHTFVDEANDDFTPDTGSHLIAAGPPTKPTCMQTFESTYSWASGMTWKDINGNTRPANTTDWDIGAIQST